MASADVVVIGAGAAGLMCASVAGQRGRSVLVLEGSNKAGKKILMSGGGRCNFTNLFCSPDDFVSANPAFCISALRRYRPEQFVELVERYDIAYHEKAAGQLFCDTSSKQIVALLHSECELGNVSIKTQCDVQVLNTTSPYVVAADEQRIQCNSLVIATGGLSIPKMGATDFGYRLARRLGIHIQPTRAGLVPYTLSGPVKEMSARLSGVSTDVRINIGKQAFHDDLLLTHRGLSGPAALQSSNAWRPGSDLEIDLLPDLAAGEALLEGKREQPQQLLRTLLSTRLPRALTTELQDMWWPAERERPLAEISNARLLDIGASLNGWRVRPSGTEGYRTAEVTLGGVDTDAVSSRTMECKQYPGLYFIGEVLDVTGKLGGYNFQWAWASGVAAGEVV